MNQVEEDRKPDQEKSVVVGFGYTSIMGRRPDMEDAHGITPRFRNRPDEFFAGVYDGHGSLTAARLIAKNLRTNLSTALDINPRPAEAIRQAFLLTDTRMETIYGATVAVVYIQGQTLYVANAGDTRVVLDRNGSARRLSHDHKADDPDEINRVREMGGRVDFGTGLARVSGILSVARALGDHHPDLEGFVSPEPFITETHLESDDRSLIIACDGVWDVISDEEAVNIVHAIDDPKVATKALRDEALRKGSTDNITVVLLKFTVA